MRAFNRHREESNNLVDLASGMLDYRQEEILEECL